MDYIMSRIILGCVSQVQQMKTRLPARYENREPSIKYDWLSARPMSMRARQSWARNKSTYLDTCDQIKKRQETRRSRWEQEGRGRERVTKKRHTVTHKQTDGQTNKRTHIYALRHTNTHTHTYTHIPEGRWHVTRTLRKAVQRRAACIKQTGNSGRWLELNN